MIITNLALRSVRARAMAYFGARIDSLIGKEAFEAILNMPVLMIETASVGTQLARLKQFESMRELFTGTLAASIIDVPFIFIFIAAIALWGGQLVWIPLSLIVVYFILSIIALLITRNLTNACGVLKQRRQILLHEIVGKRSAIRMLNAEGVWVLKHRQLSESIAQMNGRIHRFNMVTHSVGEILASVAGVATLGFGALGVAGGSMTAGALIGTMTLVWRVLSPIQSMYLSTPRIDQAMQTFRQIDRLMKIRGERIRSRPRSVPRKFRGKITVQRLAFRYPQSPDAVLRNIELEAKPGEMIAITGASGAGKTTLLRLLAGLYPPAMGAILVDETDLRQVDPLEWRAQISYLPEHSAFFYGSGAQNIRLARPDASDDDVVHALAEMGFEQGQGLFANGIDHRLKARDFENLPDAVRQRLALARCFIKDAPIYLLDNPEASLDSAAEAWLLKKLGALKGKSTVIFSTFRPSHMLVADRLILLKDGQVVLDGPPQHVLQLMQVSFQ